jgi:SAM-dependent methyltransferase
MWSDETRAFLEEHLAILCCPRCRGPVALGAADLACASCGIQYPETDDIAQLFAPNDWEVSKKDVTDEIRAFYEETPFPNYDDFDSVASLIHKARQGRFARLLDEQVPPGTRVLECGCGTGQLSNFLSIARRTVFGTDLCLNSLRLGQEFRRKNQLRRVLFLQMNLFRPAFRPGSFHLVVSNGVLHHTADPPLAFRTIADLVRPGGYLLVGLYHRYGRLITDARRVLFRISRERLRFLDPNLRGGAKSLAKQRAWFADQYENPHESKHTIGEVLHWLEDVGFSFVKSIPSSVPFRSFSERESLFRPERAGGRLERAIAELAMIPQGSLEGGFFVVIGQRPAAARP